MAIGVALLAVSIMLSDIPTMISSFSWPSVFGEITSRRLVSQRFKEYDGDYYTKTEGYLKYSYMVEGRDYSGFAVNALEEISCPESTARKYPQGREVEVYYNPRNPSQAVLEPGFVISGKAFSLLPWLIWWCGVYFLTLGIFRRRTGRRYFIRGWPDDSGFSQ